MAATDLERLVVQLSADITKYERAMSRAQGITNKQLGAIQKKTTQSGAAIAASFARFGAAIIGGLAVGQVTRELAQLSNAATKIDNSLKVAGLSGQNLEDVYKSLSDAAKRNGAPVEALVTLYGRAALVQKELGVSQQELVGFTNNVAVALRVAGTDAQSASGALLQLSQALGGGTVRAEEFNSILEGATPIAQAAAAGLKEAGGSVAKLRSLVVDGKISSEAFFRAFEAGAPILEDKAAKATFTLDQASSNLYTSLIDVAREFNKATGASESFAGGINNVAGAISGLDVGGFIAKIKEIGREFDDLLSRITVFDTLNKVLGDTTEDGLAINVDKEQAESDIASMERRIEVLQQLIENNTKLGIDTTETMAALAEVQAELAKTRAAAAAIPDFVAGYEVSDNGIKAIPLAGGGSGGPLARNGIRRPKATKTVSTSDFKPQAGSGKGKKKKESEYAREVEQIRERTAALIAETAAQAGVNPLVDDYGFASTRARVAQELLTAAVESKIAAGKELSGVEQLLAGNFDTLTPKAREQAEAMLALATSNAEAEAAQDRLQESQDKLKSSFDDFKNTSKDIVSGFISDLREGKSGAEALAGALDKVVDKLIDVSLNSIFDGFGGGGGFLSFIPKLLGAKDGGPIKLAGGGRVRGPGGPRGDKIPAMLSDGEYVINAAAVRKNRALLDAINSGRVGRFADGGMVSGVSIPTMRKPTTGRPATYAPVYQIDARGADQAAIMRLEQSLKDRDRRLDKQIDGRLKARELGRGRA